MARRDRIRKAACRQEPGGFAYTLLVPRGPSTRPAQAYLPHGHGNLHVDCILCANAKLITWHLLCFPTLLARISYEQERKTCRCSTTFPLLITKLVQKLFARSTVELGARSNDPCRSSCDGRCGVFPTTEERPTLSGRKRCAAADRLLHRVRGLLGLGGREFENLMRPGKSARARLRSLSPSRAEGRGKVPRCPRRGAEEHL